MRLTPWSERRLDYGRDDLELPILVERLRGTPSRVLELFRGRPVERLTMHLHGRWCALEHVAHLIELQDHFERRLDDLCALRPEVGVIDLTGQEVRLRAQCRRSPGDVLEEFRLKRMAFVERVQELEAPVHRHVARHPCEGRPYRTVDMLHWIAEHDDHHLASIRSLLGERTTG